MKGLLSFFSRSQPLKPLVRVYDVKARLDWGEPALTIIDVRDRGDFNEGHIRGAISIPEAELAQRALTSLELDRDIYLYANTDEESAIAAESLRAVGYRKVAVLRGGAAAWKAVGFPMEAISAIAA
jgi:rhodanese-related sulfurtransferase